MFLDNEMIFETDQSKSYNFIILHLNEKKKIKLFQHYPIWDFEQHYDIACIIASKINVTPKGVYLPITA